MRIFDKLFKSLQYRRKNLPSEEQNFDELTKKLFHASMQGNIAIVSRLLERYPNLINARDETGDTALHIASYHGHVAVVQQLLEKGADPNIESSLFAGKTPIERCYCEIQVCIGDGGYIDRVGRHTSNYLRVAELLLKYGARRPDEILFDACWNCDKEMVKLLLDYGTNINLQSHDSNNNIINTPLLRMIDSVEAHWMELSKAKELLSLLLSRGVNVYICAAWPRMTAIERLRAYLKTHYENREYQLPDSVRESVLRDSEILKEMIFLLEKAEKESYQ